MTDNSFARLLDVARQMVLAEEFVNQIDTFPGTPGDLLRGDHEYVKSEILSIVADEIHRRQEHAEGR